MACTKTVLRAAASVLIVVQARAMAGEADSSRRLLFVDRFRDPVKAVTLCIEAGDSCQPVATAPAGTAVLPPEALQGKADSEGRGFRPTDASSARGRDRPDWYRGDLGSPRALTRDETAVDVLLVRQGSAPALRESRHLLPGAPQSVRFADLPPGSYRLTASGPQLVEERRTIDLSPSRQVDLGILPVRRGRLIEGMVLEAAWLPNSRGSRRTRSRARCDRGTLSSRNEGRRPVFVRRRALGDSVRVEGPSDRMAPRVGTPWWRESSLRRHDSCFTNHGTRREPIGADPQSQAVADVRCE